MSNFNRKQKRNRKRNKLKFVPQHLTSNEIDFLVNNVSTTFLESGEQLTDFTKNEKISSDFIMELFNYSSKSTQRTKEIQAIVQKCLPEQLEWQG